MRVTLGWPQIKSSETKPEQFFPNTHLPTGGRWKHWEHTIDQNTVAGQTQAAVGWPKTYWTPMAGRVLASSDGETDRDALNRAAWPPTSARSLLWQGKLPPSKHR